MSDHRERLDGRTRSNWGLAITHWEATAVNLMDNPGKALCHVFSDGAMQFPALLRKLAVEAERNYAGTVGSVRMPTCH